MKHCILIFIICISSFNLKLVDVCLNNEDNCLLNSKRKDKIIFDKEGENYHKEQFNTNPSLLDFLKQAYLNMFHSYNQQLLKYIDGLSYILETISKVYHNAENKQDNVENYINENITLINPESVNQTKNEKKNTFRNLDVPFYMVNNTDLYNNSFCYVEPDIKAFLYTYICNREFISKTKYEKLKVKENNSCSFYNNTVKLCLCPITYNYCRKSTQEIYCEIKGLTANKYNLTANRNTFYFEYFHEISLPLSENKFNFNLTVQCGTPETPEKLQGKNFYLSLYPESDFEIVDINYGENYTGEKKQLSKEQLLEGKEKILKYYLYNDQLILYDDLNLELTFTIYDMYWVLPLRKKTFPISQEKIEKFISGQESFEFLVDLKALLAEEPADEIYKDNKYKQMDKGDLLFYEINLKSKENNEETEVMKFFSFRGDINKLK